MRFSLPWSWLSWCRAGASDLVGSFCQVQGSWRVAYPGAGAEWYRVAGSPPTLELGLAALTWEEFFARSRVAGSDLVKKSWSRVAGFDLVKKSWSRVAGFDLVRKSWSRVAESDLVKKKVGPG